MGAQMVKELLKTSDLAGDGMTATVWLRPFIAKALRTRRGRESDGLKRGLSCRVVVEELN